MLAEHLPELLAFAVDETRASSAVYASAVHGLLAARRDWMADLQLVAFASSARPQSWYDGEDGGTNRIGKVEVRPFVPTEAVGRLAIEVAERIAEATGAAGEQRPAPTQATGRQPPPAATAP